MAFTGRVMGGGKGKSRWAVILCAGTMQRGESKAVSYYFY